jgi:hypothetical protein
VPDNQPSPKSSAPPTARINAPVSKLRLLNRKLLLSSPEVGVEIPDGVVLAPLVSWVAVKGVCVTMAADFVWLAAVAVLAARRAAFCVWRSGRGGEGVAVAAWGVSEEPKEADVPGADVQVGPASFILNFCPS